MINVNQITSRLASMPDQALQQYAAMHKNDPYTVALALAESNRRKQMRQGAQMQAPQQPKVVDQELAGMAQAMPEDTGIGQLPAPSMQRMAEGGIVAFANEGYVDPAFTYGIESEYGGLSPMQQAPLTPAQLARIKLEKEREKNMAASRAQGVNLRPTVADPRIIGATPPEQTVGTLPAAPGLPSALPPAAPLAGTKAPAAPVAAKPAGLPALSTKPMTAEEAAAAGKKFGDEGTLTSALEKLRTDTEKGNKEAKAEYEKGLAALPKVGSEAEERLKKQEAADAVSQADAKGMAIFKAGLAIMSGTSQNAFENLGKGALAGLEEYSGSIKEFRKLARERDKAYADIESARNAAARDDLKTATSLQEKAMDRLSRVEEKGVDVTATLFKTNKETAATIWRDSNDQAQANARVIAQESGANARTAMQLNQEPSEIRGLRTLMREPGLLDVAGKLAAAKGEPKAVEMHKTEWAKSPMLQAKYPNVDDYVRMMTGTTATGGGGGFKVLGSRPAP